MRIMLVSHGYPPEKFGGAEVYTRNLARELAKSHDVMAFVRTATPGVEYAVEEKIVEGVRVATIRNTYSLDAEYERHYNNPALDAPFVALLKSFKPDIVHFTYMLGGMSATLLERANEFGAKTALTLMDFHYMCAWGQLLDSKGADCPGPDDGLRCAVCFAGEDPYAGLNVVAKYLMKMKPPSEQTKRLKSPGVIRMAKRNDYLKRVVNSASVVIAPTSHIGDVYAKWGVRSIRVPFGIDKSLFDGFARKPSDRIRFGFIGRLLPLKGLHVLVDALKKIDADPSRRALYVYADDSGDTEKKYLAEVMSGAPAGVEFRGTFAPEKIKSVYEDMDVLVMPSLWAENSPMTLLYALHTKTPVIAADIGGVRDAVGEDGAFLYPPRDSAALAKIIERVIRDPASLAGLKKIAVDDMTAHAARLVDIYGGLKS